MKNVLSFELTVYHCFTNCYIVILLHCYIKLIYIFIKKTIFSQLHTSVVIRQIRVNVLV